MDINQLTNLNVESYILLPTPEEIRKSFPVSSEAADIVGLGRKVIADILDDKDPRLFLVVGPCSIHDTKGALDYAQRLKELSEKVKDQFLLVMRVYFEKPRTTVGWKGLINDPYLDDSFHIEEGLKIARKLLIELAEMGLPTATEALDPIVPQYLSDLIAWTAIGARTTESQTHREMASGLSMPVGFKNGTDGNIQVALNAMKSSLTPHSFLGVNSEGQISVYKTKGNSYSHIVLRGGTNSSNYDAESVKDCQAQLVKAGLLEKIMIDCSHGNSKKDPRNQPLVFQDVIGQVLEGNGSIIGLMIESNIHEGNQKIPEDLKQLKYGVSITDGCIDWKTTKDLILEGHKKLSTRG